MSAETQEERVVEVLERATALMSAGEISNLLEFKEGEHVEVRSTLARLRERGAVESLRCGNVLGWRLTGRGFAEVSRRPTLGQRLRESAEKVQQLHDDAAKLRSQVEMLLLYNSRLRAMVEDAAEQLDAIYRASTGGGSGSISAEKLRRDAAKLAVAQ